MHPVKFYLSYDDPNFPLHLQTGNSGKIFEFEVDDVPVNHVIFRLQLHELKILELLSAHSRQEEIHNWWIRYPQAICN